MKKIKKLSVIILAFNEKNTIIQLIQKVRLARLPQKITKEIIVVNDASTDDTAGILKKLKFKQVKIIHQKKNQGKGAAIRRGLKEISGDVVVIQDADLEYNPNEYSLLIRPILDNKASVVYGSRFASGRPHRVHLFWHMVGNKLLTLLSNALTNLNLTDMETCYKMFTREVAEQLNIEENRFGFEPEITAKIAKLKCSIYEVGISYSGRTYEEGKKIDWKDGIHTLWCILKYNLRVDNKLRKTFGGLL
jgi:glycosyltransferase involved in cell wall biosynthesis